MISIGWVIERVSLRKEILSAVDNTPTQRRHEIQNMHIEGKTIDNLD